MNTLADRVREALKKSRMTQADLARACKITPTSVNNWLTGETRSMKGATAIAAANALGVSAQWLASGVGSMSAATGIVLRQATSVTDSPDLVEICALLRRLTSSDRGLVLAYAQALADKGQAPRKANGV